MPSGIAYSTALTARETEVLCLLAAGRSDKELAEELGITHHTVRSHLQNIYGKLAVPGRLEAALWAIQHLPRPPVVG